MKFSDAEWQIMNALWKRHPATAREIIDQIPGEVRWAYTTVKTMLTRLAAKGAVSEQKRGRISVYEPCMEQDQARKKAVRHLFDKVLDGAAAPLMHFLIEERKISEKEREALIRMLSERNRKGGSHD